MLPRRPTAKLRVLPDYLIIGAQKAGTSALQRYLETTPGVQAPLVKEVHYFDNHYGAGADWYRAHFPTRRAVVSGQITGEASPYYLLHPWAPARVAALLPDVRLIVLLREPARRAYSHFQHSRALGREPLTSFDEALDREAARTAGGWAELSRTGRRQPAVEWYSYMRRGRYAAQLARWYKQFPPERLLVIFSEELFADPQPQLERVHAHLGLRAPVQAARFVPSYARTYPPMPVATVQRLAGVFTADMHDLEQLLARPRPAAWPNGDTFTPVVRNARHRDN